MESKSNCNFNSMFIGATNYINNNFETINSINNYTPTADYFNKNTPLSSDINDTNILYVIKQWINNPDQSIFTDSTHTPYFGNIENWNTQNVFILKNIFNNDTQVLYTSPNNSVTINTVNLSYDISNWNIKCDEF